MAENCETVPVAVPVAVPVVSRALNHLGSGGVADAQPPANRCDPSGVETAATERGPQAFGAATSSRKQHERPKCGQAEAVGRTLPARDGPISHAHGQGMGLIDCISFVVMSERGVVKALTADEHFQQGGFRALLREAAV